MAHVHIYSARHVPLSARELDSSIAPHCATLQHSATDTNVMCHARELEPSAAATAAATRDIAVDVGGENYSVATFCTGYLSTKAPRPRPRARVRTLSLSFSCALALSFPRSFLSLPLPVSLSLVLSHGGGRSGREAQCRHLLHRLHFAKYHRSCCLASSSFLSPPPSPFSLTLSLPFCFSLSGVHEPGVHAPGEMCGVSTACTDNRSNYVNDSENMFMSHELCI